VLLHLRLKLLETRIVARLIGAIDQSTPVVGEQKRLTSYGDPSNSCRLASLNVPSVFIASDICRNRAAVSARCEMH
jgi:hypothetical protein